MKKNIEWLKAEVEKQDIVMDKGYIYTNDLIYLIDSLDEPEVLSQEGTINIVLDDLKEYIKEQQSLSQNVGLAHTSAGNDTHYKQYDYVLECISEYEPSDELQNLLVSNQELPLIPKHILEFIIRAFDVETTPNTIETLSGMTTDRFLEVIKDSKLVPKQKLPVIPEYVAEWIEDYIAKGFDLYRTLNVLESGASNLVKIYRWYRNNTLEFTTAYLTKEYKVDEIRYHVRVPYSKLHYYFIDNGCTGAAELFGIDENHNDFELTEDEINEYLPGISKKYWEEIK